MREAGGGVGQVPARTYLERPAGMGRRGASAAADHASGGEALSWAGRRSGPGGDEEGTGAQAHWVMPIATLLKEQFCAPEEAKKART